MLVEVRGGDAQELTSRPIVATLRFPTNAGGQDAGGFCTPLGEQPDRLPPGRDQPYLMRHRRGCDRKRANGSGAVVRQDPGPGLAGRPGTGGAGVELEKAVSDFFEEYDLRPEIDQLGGFRRYRVAGITPLQGDFFALQAEHLAQCRAFYDRAALIALPPEMRERYAGHLQAVPPTRSPGLLVTIDHPQAEMAGPPFAVPDEEVRGYYAGGWRIEELERGDVLGVNWKFLERGVSRAERGRLPAGEKAETGRRAAHPSIFSGVRRPAPQGCSGRPGRAAWSGRRTSRSRAPGCRRGP